VINRDGRPTIIDTPLTLIFKMRQGAFHFLFGLSRQPILRLWLYTTCHSSDYPRYMTNNLWHSIDAHCHDGARRVLQSVSPIKVAENSFMTNCHLFVVWLPMTYDQKPFALCRRSSSRGSREGIAICFAYNGGEQFLYDWLQPIGSVITLDTWPKIVDALLTLISKMG